MADRTDQQRVVDEGLKHLHRVFFATQRVFDVAGHQVHVLPSIGAAIYPEHGEDDKQLIRCADEAMYGAKKSGGNRLQLGADSDR